MIFHSSQKIFLHVDCDSFFASCEVLRNPSLKGKFVCVGGDIIVASSYEAKALGVKVGTPIWEARRILKDQGHYFGVDIHFYTQISILLMNYLRENTLAMEPFSIDEAFCEVTGLPELYKVDIYDYVKKMQDDILEQIGIPVSIGVSNTRIRAKIFSKVNKPYGICLGFEKEYLKELFQTLPLKDIPFVGKKSQEKLHYRCNSIYDYLRLGFWEIKKQLGKTGADLWLELLGVDIYVVKKSKVTKSISRTRSFNHQKTSNKAFLWSELSKNLERAFCQLYKENFEVKTVVVMFRDSAFKQYHIEYRFGDFINDRHLLVEKVKELFERGYDKNNIYRSTGIYFSDLRSYLPRQLNIFDTPLRGKENHYLLNKKIYAINESLGCQKIAFGADMLGTPAQHNFKIRA